MALERDGLLSLYYYMRPTRSIEERVQKLYPQGKIVGGVYRGDGHEGITLGSAFALRKEDIRAPQHRDLGAQLVRGLTPRQVLAQHMGRRTGPTRGRHLRTRCSTPSGRRKASRSSATATSASPSVWRTA